MGDFIRVLVAVEVRLYREGLTNLLSQEPGLRVVGIVETCGSVIERSKALRPDVVLLDCSLNRGATMIRELLAISPELRVIALGLADSDPEVLSCAQAGMSGYVTREGTREQLVASIRGAVSGEFICSAHVAAMLLKRVASGAPSQLRSSEPLTRREHQVIDLVSQNLSNKAIATRLNIELSTVKNHVHHILEKLHVNHRGQVVSRLHQGPERDPDPWIHPGA